MRSVILIVLGVVVGCGPRTFTFEPNRVRAMSLERSRDLPLGAASDDVTALLVSWFGTPDAPRWPMELLEGVPAKELVLLDRLQAAAGAVASDQADRHAGLYREHCVRCHGISGDGAGAAAIFQSPYPRDLRAGIFKWKSTPRDQKPTREDLSRLLVNGVAGSAMPSFANVKAEDRESLLDYLIYLSVRGETERELLAVAVDDLDYADAAPRGDLRLLVSPVNSVSVNVLNAVVSSWTSAQSAVVPEDRTTDLDASIARGQTLFHGQVARCSACHGVDGIGQTETLDYDDWTRDFTTRIGLSPDDVDGLKPFRKAGALPPRKVDPRRLQGGVLRGGAEPETIFRRIQYGIAGSPMPGIDVHEDTGSGVGLSVSQVWDLVHYVELLVSHDR